MGRKRMVKMRGNGLVAVIGGSWEGGMRDEDEAEFLPETFAMGVLSR